MAPEVVVMMGWVGGAMGWLVGGWAGFANAASVALTGWKGITFVNDVLDMGSGCLLLNGGGRVELARSSCGDEMTDQ